MPDQLPPPGPAPMAPPSFPMDLAVAALGALDEIIAGLHSVTAGEARVADSLGSWQGDAAKKFSERRATLRHKLSQMQGDVEDDRTTLDAEIKQAQTDQASYLRATQAWQQQDNAYQQQQQALATGGS